MAIDVKLDDGQTIILLPGDTMLENEYNWTPIGQEMTMALDGEPFFEYSTQNGGRNIKLTGSDYAWIKRSVVDSLYAMASIIGQSITLTMSDLSTYTVVFDQSNPIVARPVRYRAPPSATDNFYYELNFITLGT